MGNPLSPILGPLGLDPSAGYDTAAAGAKAAQGQANALSDLQWQRQMQGLGQAQQYTGQLQSLYNSMYSPGGGAPAAGGMQMGGAPQMGPAPGGDMLLPKTPDAPAPSSPGLSSLLRYNVPYQIFQHVTAPAGKAAAGYAAKGAASGLSALRGMF